ncbi:alpha/beta fold hydrolase [Luteimonas saliphila]|uniref:alpha/beta fold hydrolase n=1 Tax=Luteimonas saliphila TaxID=2804919 RepID=UPI00192DD7D9|nr:alpha/beta hydrolase [Luteimonas saliphila]
MYGMPGGDCPSSLDAEAPGWFRDALAVEHELHRVEVGGATVEAIAWGRRGRPGLLFAHGMLAHARWWDFIAPLLSDDFRCAALSFSGMGHSGWRERYSMRTYVDEMAAVIAAAGLDAHSRRPVVVAHSFGSFAARRFAEWRGEELGGVVLLDAPIRASTRYAPSQPPRSYFMKPYATVGDAVRSFRLVPQQACANAFLVAHVAVQGLRRRDDHWIRSFDPQIRVRMMRVGYHAGLVRTACPLAFVWGERSALLTDVAREQARQMYPLAPWIEIPDAAHHVMLDQPLALVAALRGLLLSWPAHDSPAPAH